MLPLLMSRLPMSSGFSFSLSGSAFLTGAGFGTSLFFSLSPAKTAACPANSNHASATATTRRDASILNFMMHSLLRYLSRLFVESRWGDARPLSDTPLVQGCVSAAGACWIVLGREGFRQPSKILSACDRQIQRPSFADLEIYPLRRQARLILVRQIADDHLQIVIARRQFVAQPQGAAGHQPRQISLLRQIH